MLGHEAPSPEVSWARFREGATAAGLRVVDGAEHVGFYRFAEVSALVAYLRRVPWDVPEDFSVNRYAEQLMQLHAACPAHGEPLPLTRKRFWLKAVRPQEQR